MPAISWDEIRSRPRRLAAAAGLASYAILALVAGLDRLSPGSPETPSVVGWTYDAGAALAKAGRALRANDPQAAVDYAARAVLASPVDTHVVGTYATALSIAGNKQAAAQAYRVAGELGWRDDSTQLFWFNEGLRIGDAQLAAQHLDALLRQTPLLPFRNHLFDQILVYDEGRTALAARLRNKPQWAGLFVQYVDDLDIDQLAARADTVRRAGRGPWGCLESGHLIDRLLAGGLYDEARGVMQVSCPTTRALVYDGEFDNLDLNKQGGGLDWTVVRRGDLVAAMTKDSAGRHRLSLSASAIATTPALTQRMVLSPGTYRLSWHMPDTASGDANNLTTTLDCSADLAAAQAGRLVDRLSSLYVTDFTVPASCPAPTLIFWLEPNHPVNIAGIALNPVRPATPAAP